MDIKQIEKEFDEFIDKLFSRAEIPNYANDAKQPIKSFYRQQIKKLLEGLSEEIGMNIPKDMDGKMKLGMFEATRKIDKLTKDFNETPNN